MSQFTCAAYDKSLVKIRLNKKIAIYKVQSLFGQCPNRPGINFNGASLGVTPATVKSLLSSTRCHCLGRIRQLLSDSITTPNLFGRGCLLLGNSIPRSRLYRSWPVTTVLDLALALGLSLALGLYSIFMFMFVFTFMIMFQCVQVFVFRFMFRFMFMLHSIFTKNV